MRVGPSKRERAAADAERNVGGIAGDGRRHQQATRAGDEGWTRRVVVNARRLGGPAATSTREFTSRRGLASRSVEPPTRAVKPLKWVAALPKVRSAVLTKRLI